MKKALIYGAVRTPTGNFGGSLKDIQAVDLGSIVIAESLKRAGINPVDVDEVIMGNVLQAGLGLNTARQAAMRAGIPREVPSFTVNKVCGSGLKAVTLAARLKQPAGHHRHKCFDPCNVEPLLIEVVADAFKADNVCL